MNGTDDDDDSASQAALATGMRNDAPDESVVQRQAWRLAEISLEELAFVVMARAAACSGAGVEGEGDGGAYFMSQLESNVAMWQCACEAAAQGLRQMAQSTWRPMECTAAAQELEAWCAAGVAAGVSPISNPEDALRMRASLQRAQRLVEAHTSALIEGYGDSPAGLGEAFGQPHHVGQTFVDSIIRAGVPFQLSRLITPMLRASSNAAGLGAGGYDAIVMGTGVGRLVECDRLEPGAVGDAADGPVVALVWGADGDEEVSAAGRHVKGVVLARDLPHLSHLAIRARQEQVPLAATEDKGTHLAAKSLLGQQVALNVGPNGVSLALATEADIAAAAVAGGAVADAAAAAAPVSLSAVTLSDTLECRPLSEASLGVCGAKATVCGELVRVAERSDSGFKAPAGVFVPFGAMEACLKGAGKGDELTALVAAAETAATGGDPAAIEVACKSVRDVIASVDFPPELAAQLAASFPNPDGATRVVVRSSANVEDLAGMSAAGLYESVLGVSASSAHELGEAVKEVWASLYSRRAVLARRAAGVPQASAHMAVLVQEMAPSQVSFVLHTAATSGGAGAAGAAAAPTPAVSATLEAEVAVGLGETLASGARGSPWRLEVDQATGAVRTTAFASLGSALMIRQHAAHLGVQAEAVDYSRQELSLDPAARVALGRRLAAVGAALEAEYGAPQDIEGGVVGDDIYVVQSRPQPM